VTAGHLVADFGAFASWRVKTLTCLMAPIGRASPAALETVCSHGPLLELVELLLVTRSNESPDLDSDRDGSNLHVLRDARELRSRSFVILRLARDDDFTPDSPLSTSSGIFSAEEEVERPR